MRGYENITTTIAIRLCYSLSCQDKNSRKILQKPYLSCIVCVVPRSCNKPQFIAMVSFPNTSTYAHPATRAPTTEVKEPWMDFFHTNDFKRLHKQVCHVCQILITIGRDTLIHPQMACSQDSPKIYRLQEDDLAQRKAVFQHRWPRSIPWLDYSLPALSTTCVSASYKTQEYAGIRASGATLCYQIRTEWCHNIWYKNMYRQCSRFPCSYDQVVPIFQHHVNIHTEDKYSALYQLLLTKGLLPSSMLAQTQASYHITTVALTDSKRGLQPPLLLTRVKQEKNINQNDKHNGSQTWWPLVDF